MGREGMDKRWTSRGGGCVGDGWVGRQGNYGDMREGVCHPVKIPAQLTSRR